MVHKTREVARGTKGVLFLALAVAAIGVLGGMAQFGRAAAAQLLQVFVPTTTPALVSYQGVLEVNGSLYTGTGSFQFALYDAATGGTALWSETQAGVAVSEGLFQVNLGSTAPLTPDLFDGPARWLGVSFDGEAELAPRQRLTSAPYALRAALAERATVAADAEALGGVAAANFVQTDTAVKLGNTVTACSAAASGVLRWDGTTLQVCDGIRWNSVNLTPVIDDVVLYNAGTRAGNIGARAGADSLCSSSANRPVGYTNARGFLSVSGTDTIAAMPGAFGVPTTRPVKSPAGLVLANNWADLLDGSISRTLAAANVIPGGGPSLWWSGSTASGAFAGSNCSGWNTNSSSASGVAGAVTTATGSWLQATTAACSAVYYLLCVAY